MAIRAAVEDMRLKSGLADILKGGVIMDVLNATQDKIASEAGGDGARTNVCLPIFAVTAACQHE
jgi:pyridoxal biosynthesis lyase PdxS